MITKADRTRQLIIEKTAPIFNSKGFAGTSINDITEATGLTKGSVYGNFDNKNDVATAAFDYNFNKVVTYIKSRMEGKRSCIEKLLVYPEVYRDFLKWPFLKAGCPLLNTAIEADDTHPLLREKALQALRFWKASVEKLVNAGIENNEIKSSVDASEFSTVLMSLIEGAIMQAKLAGRSTELVITMNYLEKFIQSIAR